MIARSAEQSDVLMSGVVLRSISGPEVCRMYGIGAVHLANLRRKPNSPKPFGRRRKTGGLYYEPREICSWLESLGYKKVTK